MDTLFAVRLISIFGVIASSRFFSSELSFMIFVWIVSIAHYFVGAIHSRRLIGQWLSSPRTSIPLGLTLVTWSLFFVFQFDGSALISFLIHHISGESVPYSDQSPRAEARELKPLRLVRFFWYLGGLLFCFRASEPFRQVPFEFIVVPSAIVFIGLTPLIIRLGLKFDESSMRMRYFFFEGVFLFVVLFSTIVKFNPFWLVLFHVFLWTLNPLHTSKRSNISHAVYVFAPMVFVSLILWSISKSTWAPWSLQGEGLRWHFQFWGHLHHGFTYFLFFMNRVPILRPWLEPNFFVTTSGKTG